MYVSYMGELTVWIVFPTVAIHMYRSSPFVFVGYRRGEMTSGPRVKWDGVKGEIEMMMWTRWRAKMRGQQREWGLGGKGVKVDLQWWQTAKLWEPCQDWTTWRDATHISPGGQIRGMYGAAEETGHRVVCRTAIGTGSVIGPAYGVAVGLEPRAVARTATALCVFDWRIF